MLRTKLDHSTKHFTNIRHTTHNTTRCAGTKSRELHAIWRAQSQLSIGRAGFVYKNWFVCYTSYCVFLLFLVKRIAVSIFGISRSPERLGHVQFCRSVRGRHGPRISRTIRPTLVALCSARIIVVPTSSVRADPITRPHAGSSTLLLNMLNQLLPQLLLTKHSIPHHPRHAHQPTNTQLLHSKHGHNRFGHLAAVAIGTAGVIVVTAS